jgi:hypothetical protein
LPLLAGKTLSVASARDCPSETTVARKITKGAAQARKAIASGAKPRCTDELVGMIKTCGATVDALMSADATQGCVRTAGDASVGALLGELFGGDSHP